MDLASTGDDIFITDDGRSTFALVQGPLPTSFGPGIEAVQPVFERAAREAGFAPSPLVRADAD